MRKSSARPCQFLNRRGAGKSTSGNHETADNVEIETTNGVRQYRFCNRSDDETVDTDLVLNIPNAAIHLMEK